jgi:hypothetical protein
MASRYARYNVSVAVIRGGSGRSRAIGRGSTGLKSSMHRKPAWPSSIYVRCNVNPGRIRRKVSPDVRAFKYVRFNVSREPDGEPADDEIGKVGLLLGKPCGLCCLYGALAPSPRLPGSPRTHSRARGRGNHRPDADGSLLSDFSGSVPGEWSEPLETVKTEVDERCHLVDRRQLPADGCLENERPTRKRQGAQARCE